MGKYYLTDDGSQSVYPIILYSWEYQVIGSGGATSWGALSPTPNDVSDSVYEGAPGTFNVRCTVTYGSLAGLPPPPGPRTFGPIAVTIAPPSGFTLGDGWGVQTPAGQEVQVGIKFKTADGPCGLYMSGIVQQMSVNMSSYGQAEPDERGYTTVNAPAFNRNGATLLISQEVYADPDFQTLAIGQAAWKQTINLRVVYTDPWGVNQIYPVGAVLISDVKVDNGVYDVENHY